MKSINQLLRYASVAVALLINCNCFGTDPLGQNSPNDGSATIQTERLEQNARQGDITAVETLRQRALAEQPTANPGPELYALGRLAGNASPEDVRIASMQASEDVMRCGRVGWAELFASSGNPDNLDELKQEARKEQQQGLEDFAKQALIRLSHEYKEAVRLAARAALAELGYTPSSPQNSGTSSSFGNSKQVRDDSSDSDVDGIML